MIKYQDVMETKSSCEAMKPAHNMTSLQSVSMNNMSCVHSPYHFSAEELSTIVKTEQDHNNNNNNYNNNYMLPNPDYHGLEKGSHMYMQLSGNLTEL